MACGCERLAIERTLATASALAAITVIRMWGRNNPVSQPGDKLVYNYQYTNIREVIGFIQRILSINIDSNDGILPAN